MICGSALGAVTSMKPILDETHDPSVQSWVESANVAGRIFQFRICRSEFFGSVVQGPGECGVAIGDSIVDVGGLLSEGLLADDECALAANACDPIR